MPRDDRTRAASRTPGSSMAQILEFMEWWGGTLASMVPAWLRGAFIAKRNWVRVQRTDDTFRVYSADGSDIGTLASSAKARRRAHSGDVLVVLDPGEAFLRQRRLPATSEANLRAALRLQIPADTPFDIDEVFEDSRIVEPAATGGLLLAEQAIVRRSLVHEVQALARDCRIDLAGIDVPGAEGEPGGFNLLPETERARSDAFLPSLNRGLAIGCVLLAGLTTGLYLVSLDRQLGALEGEIETVRAEAGDVLALQRTLRARADAIGLIEAQAANPVRFTALVDQLSAALPEDTWLEGLAYDGKRVNLVGLSRSSDGLVARLENIPGIVAARVVSSVMRDQRLDADRFRIELVIDETAPAPAAAAIPAAEFLPEDNG
ncbi:PilN domain-containing protein [Hyphomonas sp.]|uniref:PilN domain-containing protein n=1 Tax=Hyphomonas sp. TaxID=87 RepID=UPI00391CA7FB